MKMYGRSGGIAPRIDLCTRWRCVVSFTPQLLYPWGGMHKLTQYMSTETRVQVMFYMCYIDM